MKVKTSVSIARDVLDALDAVAGENRSMAIERAIVEFLDRHRRETRDKRDLEIIEAAADALNVEALDALEYQAQPA